MARNLSKEQVEDNFEFKIVKKLIKQKFPWILDVNIDADALKTYDTLFLDLIVDYDNLSEIFDSKMENFVRGYWERGKDFVSAFLNVPFSSVTYEEARDLSQDVDKVANSVRKSPALPREMKLPQNRPFGIGNFIFKKPNNLEEVNR